MYFLENMGIVHHHDLRQCVVCLLYLLVLVVGYDDIKSQINRTHNCVVPKTINGNEK